MNAVELLVLMTLICGVGLALLASQRIIKERDGLGRMFAQLAFAWLLPFIGPLTVLHLLRKDLERGSGEYAAEEPPLRDGGHINQRDASID
jgi:hypothetical protein